MHFRMTGRRHMHLVRHYSFFNSTIKLFGAVLYHIDIYFLNKQFYISIFLKNLLSRRIILLYDKAGKYTSREQTFGSRL